MKFTAFIILSFLFIVNISCGQRYSDEKKFREAMEFYNSGDYEKSLALAEKLIQNDPNNYVSWTLKARSLTSLRRYPEALSSFDRAIDINPAYSKAYGYRGVTKNISGGYSKTNIKNDIDYALSEDPKNEELWAIRGSFHYKNSDFIEAIEDYKKVIEINPKNYEVLTFIGTAYIRVQDYKKALDYYDKALEVNPNSSFPNEEKAQLYMALGEYDKAISEFNMVLDKFEKYGNNKELASGPYDSKNIKAYTLNNRGYVYYLMKDYNKALEDINLSISLLSSNSYAYKNRALVHFDLSDIEKGCEDLNKSNELGFTQDYGVEVEKLIKINCK